MLGLSETEMYDGSVDYVQHRLSGYLSRLKWDEQREWERTRMIAFTVAKSLGATKSRSAEDFMKLDVGSKKTRLTEEQIEKLKNL